MSSAMAAAVTADLASAAAAIAATFGRGLGPEAPQLLPGPGSDAVPDGVSGALRTAAGTAFRPPQLLVPELSTLQGETSHSQPPAAQQQVQQPQRSMLQMSPAALLSLQQQLQEQQQRQQQQQHRSPNTAAVPEWARNLPPEVQAELLRAIATAPVDGGQQHRPAGGMAD